MCLTFIPTFVSISFSASCFMSLKYLDLSFVQGHKNWPICILLHADHQFSQRHLLKMLSFPLYGFRLFVKDQVTIGVHSLLGLQFYSIDLPTCLCTRFYNYCSVVEFEFRDVVSLEVLLLLRMIFAILGSQEKMGGSLNTSQKQEKLDWIGVSQEQAGTLKSGYFLKHK